jgi:hypothetical protein
MFVQDVFLYLIVTRHKLTVYLTNGKFRCQTILFLSVQSSGIHSTLSSIYSIKFPSIHLSSVTVRSPDIVIMVRY